LTYAIDDLTRFVTKVMKKAGLEAKEAHIFANALLYADLRGVGSHGISRLGVYSKRVKSGVIASGVVPELTTDHKALLHFDGKNGIGSSVALQVMDACMERAKEFGICFATVKNGTHFGTGAYFTEHAAKHNMIGFAISNSEAAVVPIGGSVPMLGTNPLSFSIPSKLHSPLVLDMATSVVARGKVVLAEKEGRSIPNNWSVDESGEPTTDPTAALGGAMLPFGGAKGYAISLIIDLLCSSFAGGLDSRKTKPFWDDFENFQNVGYLIGAIDSSKAFSQNTDSFLDSIDSAFTEFKNSPTAPGIDEVIIPGEIEDRKAKKGMLEGIKLSDSVIKELINVSTTYDVPHPFGTNN